MHQKRSERRHSKLWLVVPTWGRKRTWNLGAEIELLYFSLCNWHADLSWLCVHLCGFYEGKNTKSQKKSSYFTLTGFSFTSLCPGKLFFAGEASMWGSLGPVWNCSATRPMPLQKLEQALFLKPCGVGLQSLAPLCGCLAFWGLSTAPGTHALCLLSLRSPSLGPAVPAACSANDTLPVSHPLTSCFHSFLTSFNLFPPHSSLSTLPSQRCPWGLFGALSFLLSHCFLH